MSGRLLRRAHSDCTASSVIGGHGDQARRFSQEKYEALLRMRAGTTHRGSQSFYACLVVLKGVLMVVGCWYPWVRALVLGSGGG